MREDLIRSAKSIGDRPFEFTNLRFAQTLYRRSPYRFPLQGDETTLPKIQTADLKRAYETMFCGSNLVISVVGDVDANRVVEMARHSFGSLRKEAR